jgi:hypothetical protein
MAQVIVYSNSNGGVCVCTPTGEISIDEVLVKDCPEGSFIIDDSLLPQGPDDSFFNAWVLNNKTISVDIQKAKNYYLEQYNNAALNVAQSRQLNTLAGINNNIDDATWQSKLISDRQLINSATTTSQLLEISFPTI